VLERDILDPARRGRTPLREQDLQAIVNRISHYCPDKVKLIPEVVAAFNATAHAALVLADFVAYRSRTGLFDRSKPLTGVERLLQKNVGGALRSGNPPLSHLSATGWAKDAIEAARVQSEPPPIRDDVKRWAQEQALEWVQAIKRVP